MPSKKKLIKELENYFDRLWDLPRSITGKGFRDSLEIIRELMPHKVIKFKTGQKVFDWTIPDEWNPKEAYFIGPDGIKYADFSINNLHLLNYSESFEGTVSLEELKKHLYTLPNMPEAIPYVTSYYERRWGFCIKHSEYEKLPKGNYFVKIDTDLGKGSLNLAEAVLKGETDKEILFSSYLCHPSMANNELSGPLVLASLYKLIASIPKRRYTYRFIIVPETIGAISYLSVMGKHLKAKSIAGYQITCVGDSGAYTYKYSRQHDSLSDRVANNILKNIKDVKYRKFNPAIGSDERQFCSPGFDLPIGSLMRTMYTEFNEYHTSLDNKDFISFKSMAETTFLYFEFFQLIEKNFFWKNTVMYGEPQLGKRRLFDTIGAKKTTSELDNAMWWILNYADGANDLIKISDISEIDWKVLNEMAEILHDKGVLSYE